VNQAEMDNRGQTAVSQRLFRLLPLIAVIGALVAAWWLLPLSEWIASFRDWVAQQGIWGHVMFAAVYAIATVALAPGALLTLAAGVAFGLSGFPTVVIGATIGAALSFLAGRYFARTWVERQIAKSRVFQAIDKAIEADGWKIVGLMRLSPLVPFNLQNYFFGVTKIGFVAYVVTTFFGIMPGALLYVWIGSLGAAAGAGMADEAGLYKTIAFTVGLLATGLVTFIVSKKARDRLKQFGVDEPNSEGAGGPRK
jgi:uncharacterized membrane protein YdjX (TVP38/TMEM64 family)